jgi:PAS domain S-box-containing protein
MAEAAAKLRVSPREVGKYLAQITLVFAFYFVAGKLDQVLPMINGSIGPVWPASGIALAALLLFGYQVWPGVAAGAFLVVLLRPNPLPPTAAAAYVTGITLAALTGWFLLRRIVNFNPSLSRLRDAFGFIVLGAFSSSVVSASIGASVLYAVHVRGWSGFGRAWLVYWLGDSMGVLLVTPLVLSLVNLRRSHVRARIPELAALLVLLTASCIIVFSELPFIPVRLHILAFAVLPFVIWAALRFGMSGATLSTFIIAAIATVETALGFGPFAQNTPFVNAILLDIFFAVLSVSGMTLAATIAEREQAEKEREQLVRKQAAMQARFRLAAIVESTDDAIIGKDLDGIVTDWNKGAERIYGYSADEMIGRSISILAPRDRADDLPRLLRKINDGDSVNHFETCRLRKDGARIDVSLTVFPVIDAEGRIVGSSGIARDISERKHQEAILRESEERFRLVADNTPAMIWMSGADKISTFANKAWLDFTGRSLEAELASGWAEGIHPEDLGRCIDAYAQAFDRREPFRMEYRLRRRDGEFRWILDIGVPRFNQDGSFAGFVGSGVDVTESKLAEESLASVSRRLMEAQEQERVRIAREIHDDIGQRLALLSVEIQQMKEIVPDSLAELRRRMEELEKQTWEISTDAQSLSHELHSSRLEYLGIVSAMRGFCNEFGDKHKVDIDFDNQGVPHTVPPEISVCVFRVLQESLHNALKHSGVQHFEVKLQGSPKEIQLTVRDSGVGFDPELAMNTQGLGLISMLERVKLVKGTISIASRPHSGTEVSVRVPLPAGTLADQAKTAGA